MAPSRAKSWLEHGAIACSTFFSLEQDAPTDTDEFIFTPELIAAYEGPTELAALDADVKNAKWPKWQPRIALIRNIPRN